MHSFLTDFKKLLTKYWLLFKLKWLGFVTNVKILIGIKPKPKKKGRPTGSKNKAKKNG
tara:strand:- start:1281 stop:1454 length:174 start_codon:yes stop_codon:yes gene_type:complete